MGRANRSIQLVRSLRESIARGQLAVGSPLPPVRTIARAHAVSVATVQATLRSLREQRLIESRPRQGNFVVGTGLVAPANGDAATAGKVIRGGCDPLRTRRVTLLNVPQDLSDPHAWHVTIVPAFERELMRQGFEPSKPPAFPGTGASRAALDEWLVRSGAMAGALIFADGLTEPTVMDLLDERGVPWVTINRFRPPATHNFVALHGYGMGRVLGHWFMRERFERLLWVEPDVGRSALPMEMKVGIAQGYFEADAPRCPLEVLKLPRRTDGTQTSQLGGLVAYDT